MRYSLVFFLATLLRFDGFAQPQKVSGSDGTIETRFNPPQGYNREKANPSSFAHYLRSLPLKPPGALVKYYDGLEKRTPNVYIGVVHMDIGTKNLQQCADAVMRLRGEFLFQTKQYDKIHFNFLVDGKPRYFNNYAKGNFNYVTFRKYMEYIFASANTASLLGELLPVPLANMQIGDVFIQKGNPYGHAVIVVDMAISPSGKKTFLLAQSYMPAQETQILVNPSNQSISPWYELGATTITTPEWTFYSTDLRRFKDE